MVPVRQRPAAHAPAASRLPTRRLAWLLASAFSGSLAVAAGRTLLAMPTKTPRPRGSSAACESGSRLRPCLAGVTHFLRDDFAAAMERDRRIVLQAEGNVEKNLENMMKPRFGKAKSRDLPPGALLLGTRLIEFNAKLKKPFGIRLTDGPKGEGDGVGVAEISPEGSVEDLLQDVLAGRKNCMWVQEGDAVVAINGQPVNGFQDTALELIAAAGDEVTITFQRGTDGAIKVVFPDGKHVTSPRTAILARVAESVGYDSGCNSKDGRDAKCWYKDPATGEVYCLALNVPGLVPSQWRANEDMDTTKEAQYECWIPLYLVPAPEQYDKILMEEARWKKQMEAEERRGAANPFNLDNY